MNINIDIKDLELIFSLFKKNNLKIYLVGGAVRDYILGNIPYDFDLATPVLPDDVVNILKDEFEIDDYRKSLGNIVAKKNGIRFEITTFRIEKGVINNRYPKKIRFTKSLKKDSKRRDFTINSFYLDNDLLFIDPQNGMNDLNNKKINIIGKASKRFKEDPLRIIRAIRFAVKLGFDIDCSLYKTMIKYAGLVHNLKEVKYNELFRIFNDVSKASELKIYEDVLINSYPEVGLDKWNILLSDTLDKALLKYYFIKYTNDYNLFTLSKKDKEILLSLE